MNNMIASEDSKDYLISISVKNNKLLQIMKLNGLETAADLSRACGVHAGDIGNMLNLTKSMRGKSGKIRTPAIKIAEYFNVIPEVLYPEENHDFPLALNKLSVEANYADMIQAQSLDHMRSPEELTLLTEDKDELLSNLHEAARTDREVDVLFMRYGMGDYTREHSLDEIGQKYEITPARARQICEKMFQKMRWLANNKKQ